MHYYKKNIGDYHKKAGRLTMLQHGAYTLLIDSCYDREEFPTLELALEWTWASSTDEINAVKFVLGRFFTLNDGVYVQNRIQDELDKYHKNAAINKRIAIDRENARRDKSTNRERTVNEAPPNQEPRTTNQEPRTKKKDKDIITNVIKDCPHDEILNLYHKILPMLPQVKIWNDKRQKALRTRWRESEKHQSLEFWEGYFNHVSKSLFLTGRSGGDRPFTPSLEWLINSANFVKVIEGNYQ